MQPEDFPISQQDQPEMATALQKRRTYGDGDMPALVPMECKEEWVPELQGLSLKKCQCPILTGKKKLYDDFGEMLFTHFGVSGPLILSASAMIRPDMKAKEPLAMEIDLKPALTEEQLDHSGVQGI